MCRSVTEELIAYYKIVMMMMMMIRKRRKRTKDRGTINNKDGIAATMYPLGTWFVFGNMCMDTLNKGDNDYYYYYYCYYNNNSQNQNTRILNEISKYIE